MIIRWFRRACSDCGGYTRSKTGGVKIGSDGNSGGRLEKRAATVDTVAGKKFHNTVVLSFIYGNYYLIID